MDAGGKEPVKQDAKKETGDRWKSAEFRRLIVKRMMNVILAKGSPAWGKDLCRLLKCVEKFEEKVHAAAKDEAEYIVKVSNKVKTLCAATQDSKSKALPTQDAESKLLPQDAQPKPLPEAAQPRPLPEAAQPKPSDAQEKPLLPTSPGSGAGKEENIERQEQLYEKAQKLKSMFFPKFKALYRHINFKHQQLVSSQKPNKECLDKCRQTKMVLEYVFTVLGVSKNQITTDFDERLDQAEKWIDYIQKRIHVSTNNQAQDSADVQSGLQFVPAHSRISQEEIFETNQLPQVLRTQNYHSAKQICLHDKMYLQERQVANQYSNSQQEANQMSIAKGPGNAVQQQPQCTLKATEEFGFSINTVGISASPLLEDCSNLNEFSPKPTLISDEPSPAMQRLLNVLSSVSSEALSASIDDIKKIVYLDDAIPTSELPYGFPERKQKQSQPWLFPEGRKMSRSITAMSLDTSKIWPSASDSVNQLTDAEQPDLNSFTSQAKRPRISENHALLEEIKEINNRLIDTEVVIVEKDSIQGAAGGASEPGEGIVVKLLFRAITINMDLISHFGADKKSIIKPLWLLVPTSYPFSSPVILDRMPLEAREDLKDLWMTAKAKLGYSLRNLNQPWSLRGLAVSWEQCAREAILEYAHRHGGGTFSSKYGGGWETC